ncbi:helix-turn-helix domain-containing protein [candidate division KSB1 bacterium]|nr:helix-turn-helix domain-containing protein [candidate division KSB1 bacterium]
MIPNHLIRIASALVMVFFSVFILIQRKGNRPSLRLLAAFLLAQASLLVSTLLCSCGRGERLLAIACAESPFLFLYPPFLFLYTRSITSARIRHQPHLGWHLLPFFFISLLFLINIVRLLIGGVQQQTDLAEAIYRPLPLGMLPYLLWSQLVLYAIACGIRMKRYRHKIKCFYSNLERIHLTWLHRLLPVFFLWMGLFLTGTLHRCFSEIFLYQAFCLLIEIGLLVCTGFFVYQALQQPPFPVTGELRTYKLSHLRAEEKQDCLEKLENYFRSQRPFTDPDLDLKKVAQSISVPVQHVAKVFKEMLEIEFYDYINDCRIEESKKILMDPQNLEKRDEQVFQASGFKSKAAFISAFKKRTGMTPDRFKRRLALHTPRRSAVNV